MKKRLLSLALCLVLVVGLFSGLTMNASAGIFEDIEAKKKEIIEKLITEKIEQFKEEFEIPDLDTEAIFESFTAAATEGDFGVNNCLHWEVKDSLLDGKTLTISGTGAMPDFDFPNGNLAPWWNYKALGMIKAGIGGLNLNGIKIDPIGDLKKIVIKDGVTNVSNYALFCLPAATQITLPDSVTSIGRYGIALCAKLKGISLPKAVTAIGDFGLAGNSFTAVSLPDGLQTLGRGAFDACASLSGMTLPAAITAVPDKCFNDCTKLLTVDYKGEVTAIGERAFEGCKSLTKAPIPAAVTALGNSAFNGCIALTDVTLPGGVTAVPDACFQGCTALADMKLPATVTSVGHNAFTGCKALKDVRCYGAPPTVQPGGAAEHSFEPGIVTIHYNPDPVYGWTLDTDGTWQGYKVSSKGACLHTGYGTTENTVPPTCGADGCIETVCANCGDVIATKVIPATGAHTWDNGTVTTEPTETTPGVRTFTCAVCSQTKTEVIPATGAHTFVFTKTVAPSCTEAGYDLYTCRDCSATEQRNVKPALGHKWDNGTVTTEPTETDPGTMTYTCTVCGQTKTEVIPATGPHTHVWGEGTVTVAPTETTPGVRTYTCTVCGQTRTEIIPATGSAVCPGGAACPSFRFRDVPAPSNWAHEGIDYCVRHGLMSGFDATTFSPDTVSTRAQIVMILYNLSGDTTDYSKYYVPFTDVRPGTWYYNAVAWGYDKDIVSGMTPTTFAPDGLITREQMAVLLYGYTEKYAPAYLGGAASLNGFPDAASVSNWAYAAMSWAVGNGLISGIASNGADYLAPSGGATRAQIAAIMMRYCRLTGL